MPVRKTVALQKGHDRLWIELGNGSPFNDDQWYVRVWGNERQPPAPMSECGAYEEFYRRRDRYVAQGRQEAPAESLR